MRYCLRMIEDLGNKRNGYNTLLEKMARNMAIALLAW